MTLKVRVGYDLQVDYGAFPETKAAPGTSLCDGETKSQGTLPGWVKECVLLLMSKYLGFRRQVLKP